MTKDKMFSDIQQDITRFIRHCAMRNGVKQDDVLAVMQSVLDNQNTNP
jgi:hypothetical protein